MSNRVLITDGHFRKALAAVRSLGEKNIDVTVGETTRIATALFSKYATKKLIYPSPTLFPEKFLDAIERELLSTKYDLLIPMEEETQLLIAKNRKRFSCYTALIFPDYYVLKKASDKEEILKLADTLGIPYPKSFAIKNKKDLEDGAKVIGFPAVLKPTVGIGAAGVKYVEDFEELLTSFYENSSRWDRFLLQEMLPHQGEGYGVSLLFDKNSNPVASFVHKRLREYPITGGPSTLRESVYAPKILEMGITVLKALNWYGVAMVEFKKDIRDNTLKLIEVNPRFWGSLQLAILSGVDFPYLLFLMAKNQLRYHVHKYKAGVRCRWLLPGDILHFIKNPKRFQLKPSFFSFFDKTTGYDILSLKDPLPVLARLITPITFLYDTNMKQLLKRR